MSEEIRVGIIGAGLIGKKRAAALKGSKLVAVSDKNSALANSLAAEYGAVTEDRWQNLVARADIDAVIISTSNDAIAECSIAAMKIGKHVLVEKPAGRYPEEIRRQVKVATETGAILCVGFNHRFHPALLKAKSLMSQDWIGPLMYIRAKYGHGGRLGYEKEWRGIPEISGGGELLDQGVHLIDLCRWIGGEFEFKFGDVQNFFWDWPVEDNGFLYLRSPNGQASAHIHASCTEWKNLFDFEIFGRTAKIQISGLGRSYGTEELKIYKMKPEMGPPETYVESFSGEDVSWVAEFDAFKREIRGEDTHIAKIGDALKAVEIVHAAYRSSGMSFAKE